MWLFFITRGKERRAEKRNKTQWVTSREGHGRTTWGERRSWSLGVVLADLGLCLVSPRPVYLLIVIAMEVIGGGGPRTSHPDHQESVPSWRVSSVQFSRSVMSDSLWPHGLQHTRPPSPSPTPRAYSNSCPSSQWCHPTISSFVVPFSPCPKSFPVSGSFPMSQFFASGGQSIGASASASVLPMNIQDWFPLGWTGLISLQFKGLSRVFSNTTHLKIISGGKSCIILKCIQTSLVVQWSELCLQCRGRGFHPWLEN